MANAEIVDLYPSVQGQVSSEEWETRVDLAACYRLADLYDMTDMTRTHISARVPGEETFLLNPYGLMFNEVTASSLIKVDLDGNEIANNGPYKINRAGFTIHSAVHAARPEVACVMHTHSDAGLALSAMQCGLLFITQHSMRFYNRISYHDYEGPALDLDERERLIADLGDNLAMILRNHGFLAAGGSVSEAFSVMFSCSVETKMLQPEAGTFRESVKLSSGHCMGSRSRARVRVALTCITLAPAPGSWLISWLWPCSR